MHVVFQGETGGYIEFPCGVNTAISGFTYAVTRDRTTYSFDGVVASGTLYVAKAELSNLAPDQYALLPQVVDASDRVYFLDPADLQVVEVPDFFSEAVLTSGQSVLVRLNTVESLMLSILSNYVSVSGVIVLPDIKPDSYYRHVQLVPEASWTIVHNLNKQPSVEVYDSSGAFVVGALRFVDANTCTVEFSSALSGEAVCN
jgi:hypothetical protein